MILRGIHNWKDSLPNNLQSVPRRRANGDRSEPPNNLSLEDKDSVKSKGAISDDKLIEKVKFWGSAVGGALLGGAAGLVVPPTLTSVIAGIVGIGLGGVGAIAGAVLGYTMPAVVTAALGYTAGVALGEKLTDEG